jgi:hypothetical protein
VASTLLEISNGGWSAIAAWVGLLLAALAALYARRQFLESKETRAQQAQEADRIREAQSQEAQHTRDEQARLAAEEAQPYIVIYAEPTPSHPHFIDLIIKNFGATAAKDISIRIEPPLMRFAGGSGEPVETPSLIRTLVPGQEWRTFWDSTIDTIQLHMDHHTATVEFCDSRSRQLGPYTFDLDWSHLIHRGWITTRGMPELAEAAEGIRDVLKNWKGTGNAMRVLAYDGYEHDKREREFFEERRQQREREQQEREQPSGEG